MNSFFRFFAERHKLATLITIMIIVLGISTLMGIKRDIYPDVDFGMMHIMTLYPGASPEDVELNVTNKIEEELKSVTGIEKITSISMENISAILVTIDIDASDQDDIKNEIREAVGHVTDFPSEITESPLVTELSTSMVDVIEVGLSGDIPYGELREYARIFEKKLKNISGVARLDRFGYRSSSAGIWYWRNRFVHGADGIGVGMGIAFCDAPDIGPRSIFISDWQRYWENI